MSFLEIGHYAGIDPNQWLIDDSLSVDENREIVNRQLPSFLFNADFDATLLKMHFDYIISHSIISHAAHWQLALFLENCSKVLNKNGKVIFSLRLTEANEYGNMGSTEETLSKEWLYPDNSFFHKESVIKEASKWFSNVEHKKEYTKLNTTNDRSACHDWFVLTK